MTKDIYVVEIRFLSTYKNMFSDYATDYYQEYDVKQDAINDYVENDLITLFNFDKIEYVGFYSKIIDLDTHCFVSGEVYVKLLDLIQKYIGLSQTAHELDVSRQFLYNIIKRKTRYINKKVVDLIYAKTK